jgi:hypothetical protein
MPAESSRRSEALMRHITPKFLEVDGIVSPDAFLLRINEKEISWRIRRGILAQDEALTSYADHYSFVRKKTKTRPGLVSLGALDLWRQGVFPFHCPEMAVDKNNRQNPYANLHYASAEPPPESRVALAAMASKSWLLRPHEENLGNIA